MHYICKIGMRVSDYSVCPYACRFCSPQVCGAQRPNSSQCSLATETQSMDPSDQLDSNDSIPGRGRVSATEFSDRKLIVRRAVDRLMIIIS